MCEQMGDESLTQYTTRGEGFDCVMSILTVLHIEAKADVFARCFGLLKPGGALYLEDYYEAGRASRNRSRLSLVLTHDTRARHTPSR